jgi:hypothetical protein
VKAGLTKNPRLNEAFSKADSKTSSQSEWENAPLPVRDDADWDRQEAIFFYWR